MKVCYKCLMGIEAHEGYQHAKTIYVDVDEDDEDYEQETTCEWCEDSGFDVLYEI